MVLSFCQNIDFPPYSPSKFDHADVHKLTGFVFVVHTSDGSVEVIDGERAPISEHWKDVRKLSGVICAQKDNIIFAASRGAGKILVINPISIEIVRD